MDKNNKFHQVIPANEIRDDELNTVSGGCQDHDPNYYAATPPCVRCGYKYMSSSSPCPRCGANAGTAAYNNRPLPDLPARGGFCM